MFHSHKCLLGSAMLSAAILLGSSVAYACGGTGAGPQQAQSQPGTMGQGMKGQGMMGQGGMMGSQKGMMGQDMMGPMGMMTGPMLEGRLAYIKAELAITDAQLPTWNEYASAVKARASGMRSMHETMTQAMQSGTAAARMEAHIKAMEAEGSQARDGRVLRRPHP